jgi:hypothetical protein
VQIDGYEKLLGAVNCLSNSEKLKDMSNKWSGEICDLQQILECLDSVEGVVLEEDVLSALSDLRGFVLKAVNNCAKSKVVTSSSVKPAVEALERIGGLAGIEKISPVHNTETKVLVELLDKGFSCLQPLRALFDEHGKIVDMTAEEQMPLLGEWTTACKAFEVLPLVVGGSESPSLVNGFHAKGFVDIVKGRIQDSRPKVDEVRTRVGDAFLKVGGPGLYMSQSC